MDQRRGRAEPDHTIACAAWYLRHILRQRHGTLTGRREEQADLADIADPSEALDPPIPPHFLAEKSHVFLHQN